MNEAPQYFFCVCVVQLDFLQSSGFLLMILG